MTKNIKKKLTDANKVKDPFEHLTDDYEFLDRESAESHAHSKRAFGFLMDEPELEIGARIKAFREMARYTQGELADRTKLADNLDVGITRNVISFIESGRTQPGPKEIRLISEALRITPNFLIYGNDDPFGNLLDIDRYGGRYHSKGEFTAHLTYCISRLHHNQKTLFVELLLALLSPWNKDFEAELNKNAVKEYLAAAEELKKELEKREK